MNRRWKNQDHAAMLRMREDGASNGEIGAHFGVSTTAIEQQFGKMRKQGRTVPKANGDRSTKAAAPAPKRINRHWTAEDTAMLVRMRKAGSSNREIGVQFGLSRSAIEQRFCLMRKAGLAVPPPPPRRSVPDHPVAAPSPAPVPPVDPWLRRPRRLAELESVCDVLARVAVQGLTAGVFGDPPPGRSALDLKRGIS